MEYLTLLSLDYEFDIYYDWIPNRYFTSLTSKIII